MLNKIKPILLVLEGAKYKNAKEYTKLSKGLSKIEKRNLKQITKLLPLNGEFDKMFSDVLTMKMILDECSVFSPYKAIVINRACRKRFINLEDKPNLQVMKPEDILKENSDIWIRPVENIYSINIKNGESRIDFDEYNKKCHRLKIRGTEYSIDNKMSTREEAIIFLNSLSENTLLIEYPVSAIDIQHKFNEETPIFNIEVLNHGGRKINIISENRSIYNDYRNIEVKEFINYVANKFPELEYFSVIYTITEKSFVILQIDTGMNLLYDRDLTSAVKSYLQLKGKSSDFSDKTKLEILKKYTVSAYAKKLGFVNFMYENWKRGLKEDHKFKGTTRQEKKWANKRGFYSYRIKQYGLTPQNYKNFLSDKDYKRLRPLNGKFEKWFWNKISAYFILDETCEYIPEYYYRVLKLSGKTMFAGFKRYDISNSTDELLKMGIHDVADVIAFIKNKKIIALKPSIGSHGNGFFKVEYNHDSDIFFLNGQNYMHENFREFLLNLNQGYILSEFVSACDTLQSVYPPVTPTVRIMVIDEQLPKVQHAYLRLGTSSTGNTDNVNDGGIVANINIDSGKLEKPEILMNHVFTDCMVHPDTGISIPLTVPHWEMIKKGILDVAGKLKVIEYMGFDVVVTEEGFKILEINMHQDLHKYPTYPDEVKSYFANYLSK